jgi:hypothetical protein
LSVVRKVLALALDGVSPEDHATCLGVLAAVKENVLKNGADPRGAPPCR